MPDTRVIKTSSDHALKERCAAANIICPRADVYCVGGAGRMTFCAKSSYDASLQPGVLFERRVHVRTLSTFFLRKTCGVSGRRGWQL